MIARQRRAVALATAGFAVLLAACGSNSATMASSPHPAVSATPVSAVTVAIKNFAFLPANFTVNPGATVTVRNEDLVIHTLTADNKEFNTGDLTQDQPSTFQAPTRPGKYAYHCFIHPYMTGVLTVS
ncbi:MAG: cupredoxin domain-containing protein [Pseudonocardiaceae bacterium]